MPVLPRARIPGLLLLGFLALAGCDTAEERAEAHYQRGLALLAGNDPERALIEFRNVFRLDGAHVGARLEYAGLLRARGASAEALAQYLRLAEQEPSNIEARLGAGALALRLRDFATAEEAAARAFALAPDNPEARALKATLDYRRGEDPAGAVAMARGVVAETPGDVLARMVLVADRMNANDPEAALAEADAGLARVPDDPGLHLARLAILEQLGDFSGAGDQLRRMAVLFPEDTSVREALIRWHLRAEDPAGAEAVLRAMAEAAPGEPGPALAVVGFLNARSGPEAARAELEALIAARADPAPFQQARAGLDFAEGRPAEAIAALRGLTEGAEASDAARDLRTGLAAMLAETGAVAEAAALVDAVLAEDPSHVAALKLRARAAVGADRPEEAIRDLRTALAEAPDDPEIMTLMATAHEREGSRTLAGERLARAVEITGQGAAESLRYARFLLADDRTGPAESVVVDALRRAPGDPGLLELLGEIHLLRRDWTRADQVTAILRGLDDPAAKDMADRLALASLAGQGRTEETLALVQGLSDAPGGLRLLVETHLAAGDGAAAQAAVEAALAADPAAPEARLLAAGLAALGSDADRAEALYRALIAEDPGLAEAHQGLFALMAGQGRTAEASAVLDAGIAAVPAARELRFIRAGVEEAQGNFEAAIATYEALHAEDGGNPLVANNLASLLSSRRDDADSLARAFVLARRLAGSDTPHFQDTWGWILHRRGDSAAALPELEAAVRGLPESPLAQYHLAEALFALGRTADARTGLLRAIELAGPETDLPQIAAARARLAEIEAGAPKTAAAPDAEN